MHPGDFIITPSWTWHDHGNPGTEPVVWMDGLDIQILQLFGAQFMENFPQDVHSRTSKERGTTLSLRYSGNMVPLWDPFPASENLADIQLSGCDRSRETLAQKLSHRSSQEGGCLPRLEDGVHQSALTGGFAMLPLVHSSSLLPMSKPSPAPISLDRQRSTGIYSVVEGSGAATIGDRPLQPCGSTFVVPSLAAAASGDERRGTVLFPYSRTGPQVAGLVENSGADPHGLAIDGRNPARNDSNFLQPRIQQPRAVPRNRPEVLSGAGANRSRRTRIRRWSATSTVCGEGAWRKTPISSRREKATVPCLMFIAADSGAQWTSRTSLSSCARLGQ